MARDRNSGQVAVSAERIFVVDTERMQFDHNNPKPVAHAVATFAIADNGQLQVLPSVELDSSSTPWWYPRLVARGARAFLTQNNDLTVIDTTHKGTPRKTAHQMPGYHCSSLEVSEDRAYCAMGEYGVLTFEL